MPRCTATTCLTWITSVVFTLSFAKTKRSITRTRNLDTGCAKIKFDYDKHERNATSQGLRLWHNGDSPPRPRILSCRVVCRIYFCFSSLPPKIVEQTEIDSDLLSFWSVTRGLVFSLCVRCGRKSVCGRIEWIEIMCADLMVYARKICILMYIVIYVRVRQANFICCVQFELRKVLGKCVSKIFSRRKKKKQKITHDGVEMKNRLRSVGYENLRYSINFVGFDIRETVRCWMSKCQRNKDDFNSFIYRHGFSYLIRTLVAAT